MLLVPALTFLIIAAAVPAGAAQETKMTFGQSMSDDAVDQRICNRVRYRMGVPKIDPLATIVMLDCRARLKMLKDPRPPYGWMENRAEAEEICKRYVARSSFGGTSDFLEIVETTDLEECIDFELSP